MSELTQKEIEGYEVEAAELAKKYGVSKVHVYVGIDPETDERVVGFLKEPNYLQKIVTLDKISTVGLFVAADELRGAITLREESDPKTYDESSAYDDYRLGMVGTCIPIVKVIENSFKKK